MRPKPAMYMDYGSKKKFSAKLNLKMMKAI